MSKLRNLFAMFSHLDRNQKTRLAVIGGALGCIVLIASVFMLWKKDTLDTPQPDQSGAPVITDMNAPTQDYFRGSTQVVSSTEEEELRKKMEERGRVQELRLGFTADGFKPTEPEGLVLKSATMTQFELDTSNTGLPAGTKLDISIPAAGLHSQITIPGRYGYLITFFKGGEQEIILQGEGLK